MGRRGLTSSSPALDWYQLVSLGNQSSSISHQSVERSVHQTLWQNLSCQKSCWCLTCTFCSCFTNVWVLQQWPNSPFPASSDLLTVCHVVWPWLGRNFCAVSFLLVFWSWSTDSIFMHYLVTALKKHNNKNHWDYSVRYWPSLFCAVREAVKLPLMWKLWLQEDVNRRQRWYAAIEPFR